MSDTPRTDAAIQRSCIDDLQCEWVEVDFARKLERDLKIANNWVEHHQNHVDDLIKENARLQMELDASCNAEEMRQVRAENAALRHDLNVANNWVTHHQNHVDDLIKENAALREEVEQLKGALALGQQNCDDAYNDLREERDEAKTENVALREDKQRLFYLSERWNPKNDFRNDEIGKWIVIGDHNRMISAIDAARKEAKP